MEIIHKDREMLTLSNMHYMEPIGPLLAGVVSWLVLTTGLASGSDNGNFSVLVEGISQIWCTGWPGPLWALNDKPVTIVSGDEDTSIPSGLVMAVECGDGRVVATSGQFFYDQVIDYFDNMRFSFNTIEWLDSQETKKILIDAGHSEYNYYMDLFVDDLGTKGYQVVQNSAMFTEDLLPYYSDYGVMVINGMLGSITQEEVATLKSYVDIGGGLFLSGQGWSWPQSSGGKTLNEYPMNLIAAPYGISWIDGIISDPTDSHQYQDSWSSPIFHTLYPDTKVETLYEAFGYIRSMTEDCPMNLPPILQTDSELRRGYTDAHYLLMIPVSEFEVEHPQRMDVYEFLRDLLSSFLQYYSRSVTFDRDTESVMAWTREQAYQTLIYSTPISPSMKSEITSAVHLSGRYVDIWCNHSVFILDNGCMDQQQLEFVCNYLSLMPAGLYDNNLKTISIVDFLGPNTANVSLERGSMYGRANICGARIGYTTVNPFPDDSRPVMADGFCDIVVHEVNHGVDPFTFPYKFGDSEEMRKRVIEIIEQAAPKDIVFDDLGVDWDLTKNRFLEKGYWNGQPQSWENAWNDYWSIGPGYDAGANWLSSMGNLALRNICQGPQEAFANLSELYFADSDAILDLALDRFDRGRRMCINQFLYFADVYSVGRNRTFFYAIDTMGNVDRKTVPLSRDPNGHIKSLLLDGNIYRFDVDAEGNVLDYRITDSGIPSWDVNQDGKVDILDIILVGQHYGEEAGVPTEPNPDANGNGTIDMLDIILVAKHFGETYPLQIY